MKPEHSIESQTELLYKLLNDKLLFVTKFMSNFNYGQNMQTIHMNTMPKLLKLNNLEKTDIEKFLSTVSTTKMNRITHLLPLYLFSGIKNSLSGRTKEVTM